MNRPVLVASALVLTIGVVACGSGSGTGGTASTASPVTPGVTPGVALPVTPGVATGTPPANTLKVPEPTVEGQPTVTASGLKIFDIQVGTGAAATTGDSITVNYTGWLEDGTMFVNQSSPSVPLASAIPGWREGVLGMRVGGKRRLVIPPDLAGEGNDGHTLTEDIELVSIP